MNEARRIVLENRREVVVTAIAVVAAVCMHVLVTGPSLKKNTALRGQLRALDGRIEASSIAVNDMTRLIGEDSAGTDVYDRAEGDILPDLLDAIATQGERHGVEIIQMRPGALERMTIPAQGPLKGPAETTKLVVHVTARARYRNLGEYLRSLERIPILITVQNLNVRRTSGKSPIVRATFDIETWTVRTPDA